MRLQIMHFYRNYKNAIFGSFAEETHVMYICYYGGSHAN